MAESEEELKSLLMKVKEKSEKFGLKFNIQKTKVMASGSIQFSSVQSLSSIWLFATPWIAAHQASLSITNSQSSLRVASIESVMPSSHLILCCPLFLLSPIPLRIRVFSNESTLLMRWPKYWSHYFMANRWGKNGNSGWLYFLGLQKSLQMVTAAMKLKDVCSLEENLWPT